ncbi:MAG TPA: cupin domain-containing protein [Longimicrobiaceae bacterium]|nr:cupin domain-containing protein [Longimicrobiaceae bacterium]
MTPSALQQAPATPILGPFVRLPGSPGYIPQIDASVQVLVRGSDTGGAWSLVDYTIPARFAGPPPHWHAEATEAFYGIEGVTTLEVDGREVCLQPGEVAVVPPGVVHRFRNDADRPARHLVLLTPAGFERYFDEVAALIAEEGAWPPADPGKVAALMARHDLQPAATAPHRP